MFHTSTTVTQTHKRQAKSISLLISVINKFITHSFPLDPLQLLLIDKHNHVLYFNHLFVDGSDEGIE
ncbi:hypothetical protein DPMN_012933 [Dreissena polymorpha]|uniref:Uncharacterized protein n=1 Tax=Dreissena polymorpha TaxID=45954 RepID=A0A9D4N4D8_DREPO|nr:hypothetical protein DPMN_012933 [Dreissena polymorpha]